MGQKTPKSQATSSGRIRLDQVKEQALIVSDGARDIIRIGTRPDGTFGIDSAKPGKDVYSDDPNDLAFSDRFDQLKVALTGTITAQKPANTGHYRATQAHGLGYQPAYVAYINVVDGYFPNPFIQIIAEADTNSGAVTESTVFSADDTNIYLDINTPKISSTSPNALYTYATTRAVKFYLLTETAETTQLGV